MRAFHIFFTRSSVLERMTAQREFLSLARKIRCCSCLCFVRIGNWRKLGLLLNMERNWKNGNESGISRLNVRFMCKGAEMAICMFSEKIISQTERCLERMWVKTGHELDFEMRVDRDDSLSFIEVRNFSIFCN